MHSSKPSSFPRQIERSDRAPKVPSGKNDTPRISMRRLWLLEAWESWIRQALVVLAVVVLFVFYFLDAISEYTVALTLAAGLIFLPLFVATRRAMPNMRTPVQIATLIAVVGLTGATGSLFCAGALYPGPLLHEAWVSRAMPSFSLPPTTEGTRYNIFVEGHLEKDGDVAYDLELRGASKTVHVAGTLEKLRKPVRAGRRRIRGGVLEDTEHRFTVELGQPLEEVRVSGLEPPADRVSVRVYQGWFPATMMEIAAGALYLMGLLLDARSFLRTHPSHVPIASGFVLMFGWLFFQDATLTQTVQNALGSAMLAAIVGTVVGILASALFRRLFGRQGV